MAEFENKEVVEETAPKGWLDKKFQLTKKGTSVKTEVVAGLTTFMAIGIVLNIKIRHRVINF